MWQKPKLWKQCISLKARYASSMESKYPKDSYLYQWPITSPKCMRIMLEGWQSGSLINTKSADTRLF
jgi:hypothetical protein